MEEKTIITLARMVCGVAILITSICTKTNGMLQGLSLFLIGVPIEMLRSEPKKIEVPIEMLRKEKE